MGNARKRTQRYQSAGRALYERELAYVTEEEKGPKFLCELGMLPEMGYLGIAGCRCSAISPLCLDCA